MMRTRFHVTVDIDPVAWSKNYGIAVDDPKIQTDIADSLQEAIRDAVADHIKRTGNRGHVSVSYR